MRHSTLFAEKSANIAHIPMVKIVKWSKVHVVFSNMSLSLSLGLKVVGALASRKFKKCGILGREFSAQVFIKPCVAGYKGIL